MRSREMPEAAGSLTNNLLDKLMDRLGGVADDGFLILPKMLKPFKHSRTIDGDAYSREVDFNFDCGFVDNPETFFQLPETPPDYRIATETPYLDGTLQKITFPSPYTPVNPLIGDRFLSIPENCW